MTTYTAIKRQPLLCLNFSEPCLNGRIVRGDVNLLVSAGGAGKGNMCVWMAVDQAMQGEHAILVTPEDNLEVTVRPRLEATVRALAPGCDDEYVDDVLSRVHDLTYTESGSPFELWANGKGVGSVGYLRSVVDNPTLDTDDPDPDYDGPPAAFVAIDPLLAALAEGTIATNRGARCLMGPLMKLAAETGCALVLTHHEVESGKAAGSKGLTDAARVVYRAKKDRENPDISLLMLDKSNILPPGDPVRYQIRGEGADTFIRWLDRDELAARRNAWREKPQRDQDKLLAALRDLGGTQHGKVIADKAGVPYPSARTGLSRLKTAGVVTSPKDGMFREVAAELAEVETELAELTAPAAGQRRAGWADAPAGAVR